MWSGLLPSFKNPPKDLEACDIFLSSWIFFLGIIFRLLARDSPYLLQGSSCFETGGRLWIAQGKHLPLFEVHTKNWQKFKELGTVFTNVSSWRTLTCAYCSQKCKEDRGWRMQNGRAGKRKQCSGRHFLGGHMPWSVFQSWWLRLSDRPCATTVSVTA